MYMPKGKLINVASFTTVQDRIKMPPPPTNKSSVLSSEGLSLNDQVLHHGKVEFKRRAKVESAKVEQAPTE